MHIAFFSPVWPPGSSPSGVVTYVSWMRKGLLAQGHRVSIFAGLVAAGEEDSSTHQVGKSLMDRLRNALTLRRSARYRIFDAEKVIASAILRTHKIDPIDVIEMEESFGWAAFVARTTKIPTVVKLHGPAFMTLVNDELQTALGQEKVRREGEALRRLPAIIAPSRFVLRDTLARYGIHPIINEQVENPVALAEGAELWKPRQCDGQTLLFVGRFDRIKGGDLMLLAFQIMLVKRPQLKLVFVGPDDGLLQPDGTLIHFKQFLDSLNDAALSRAVSYMGRLTPAEVASLRPTAFVTAVTSRQENQAYTVLEAMLQGCPVVCTDNRGSSESVQHGVTGMLARSGDPADIAAQIDKLLQQPDLAASLGLAAREYVLKTHSPAAVVAKTVSVYRRAIEAQRVKKAGAN